MQKKGKTKIAIAAIAGVTMLTSATAFAKQDNADKSRGGSEQEKTEKTERTQSKGVQVSSAPISTVKTTQEKTKFEVKINKGVDLAETKVTSVQAKTKLQEVAAKELPAVAQKITQIISEETQTEAAVSESVKEVEARGKVKSFLLGSDYKNLGQLRSQLVKNRNQIRQMTTLLQSATTEETKAALQTQIQSLMDQRQGMINFVTEKESSFSLFGWASKLISGYDDTTVKPEEEQQLKNEIDQAAEGTTSTTTPTTTTPTTTTTTPTPTTTPTVSN